MKSDTITDRSETQAAELLPWHKPQVALLKVSPDTGFGGGSNVDLNVEDPGFEFLSDGQLKKEVSGIEGALTGILSMSGVTYTYRTAEFPELRLAADPQIGFIAQELEQVYPQLVTTREHGFKAVNYAQLVPVLVEAIKEQQAMIEDLQAQVNELRERSAVGTL